jgi:hypothetical protein
VRILGNEYTRAYWFEKTTVFIALALLVGLAVTHFARYGSTVALRGKGHALIQLASALLVGGLHGDWNISATRQPGAAPFCFVHTCFAF